MKTIASFRCLAYTLLAALGLAFFPQTSVAAEGPIPGWKHTSIIPVLTTKDGANLSTGAVVEEFPLLVRLHRDSFDFSQAKPDGTDLRFYVMGKSLPYQIEEWDAANGTACVWVRVPLIKGDDRLEISLFWGNANAPNISDGKTVFNESNGYLSVWHLGDTVSDDVGTLESKESGTTATAGVIGKARRFAEGANISCGNKITSYPTANEPHTTELWFRTPRANANLIGWGNQQQQGKVVMQFRGPPHVNLDCWFSDGNVKSKGLLAFNEWTHAVYAYESGKARIYVNGELAGEAGRGTPLNVRSPANLTLGGWSGEFNFLGELDEARVSKVTRFADWVKLQYENQKPLQTLVGPPMRTGGDLIIKPEQAVIPEGGKGTFSAQAGQVVKLYWSVIHDGNEKVVAVDRYAYEFSPGRVSADTKMTLRLKAVFRDGVKTRDIPLTVKKTIPDPEFTLTAPEEWDGRTPLELIPRVTNLAAMEKAGAGEVKMQWSTGPFAVVKETAPGKLRLLGTQMGSTLQVIATLSNGGAPVSRSVQIRVRDTQADPWIARKPEREEKPEEGQFYARDDRNVGTLFYNGTLTEPADEVFLKVFADDKPFVTVKAKPAADKSYALSAEIKAGFIKYRVEFGTRSGGKETVLDQVGNLICGDAFLIEGQSNAEALDLKEERQKPRETNEWIRTFGGPKNNDDGVNWVRSYTEKSQQAGGKRPSLWCLAVWGQQPPEHTSHIGWWGMELAKRLVESQKVPICIINGALGGTRIDQHQRNPENPADLTTLYGNWLWRLQQARLTHGIRGVLWHQGENDQPADTPSGDYGWVNYQTYFTEMAAGWQRDLPNARRYFMFQIWPNSCGMGGADGAGDRLREKQRTLPYQFSNLSIMSTLGIKPPGGCHFPREGYDEFARLIHPLIERDVYGKKSTISVSPPNLRGVSLSTPDTLTLTFDQPVRWEDRLLSQFYLDGEKDSFVSGSVKGTELTLKMKPSLSGSKTITYLKEAKWDQENLLLGENGIAALTFCEVPIGRTKAP